MLLVSLANILGLQPELPQERESNQGHVYSESEIIEAIKERKSAKLSRNFTKADNIRKELKDKGIELIDKKDGVTDWIRK